METLSSFYVRALRTVWMTGRWRPVLFVLASSMHALGHAGVALAAGAFATALAGGSVPSGGRSSLLVGVAPGRTDPLLFGLIGLGAISLKVVGGVLASYAQARIAGEVGGHLRCQVLDGWLAVHELRRAGQSDHGGSSGRMEGGVGEQARGVAALTARVRDVETGLEAGLLGGARAIAQLVPLLILLAMISSKLAAAAIAVFLPFSVALGAMRRRWKSVNARAAAEGDALLDAADEAIRHAELWTTYGAESRVRSHVQRLGRSIALHSARVEASAAALSGANEILGAVALVFAILAARAGWLGAGADGGVLLAFAVAFFLAYKPIRDLTDARLAWSRASVGFDDLEKTLRATRSTSATPREDSVVAKTWPLAPLELRHVKLARGALGPLTLSVGPGQIVALSGPTGAGKTTLLRTLLGLESPVGGEIFYAGESLRDAPPGPRTRPFAWVPQGAPILGDTLEANILLHAPSAQSLTEVLDSIGASRLEGELGEARLGEGARLVSGGERQWIALARAIAADMPVLLLDEPTSGLDAASQSRVLEAISRLRGKRSVLMVTHRPEPLAIADAVVVFDLAEK